ncbi:ATP-binding protein [Streptomyces polyrhachis]|uniref:ATP-binding protein n=1 Tax=Streptomyces polyrhachis TaxID=1282885 RepID=A0ABW2GE41_9ACTN
MAGPEGMQQPVRQGRPQASSQLSAQPSPQPLPDGASVLELCGDPSVGEVRLPSRPESAATARRLTHALLRDSWGLSAERADAAVLLVSELVGNAVRHTGARAFGLRIHRQQGRIRVEVRDPSRGLPCLLPVRDLDTSGRGLAHVDRIADRWGVDLLPRGKSTWFEMRVPQR